MNNFILENKTKVYFGKGGNSDILCDEFVRGAREAGNEVEKIRVAAKKVAPCSACYYCRDHGGECVHKDDMADILQKMIDAENIGRF